METIRYWVFRRVRTHVLTGTPRILFCNKCLFFTINNKITLLTLTGNLADKSSEIYLIIATALHDTTKPIL